MRSKALCLTGERAAEFLGDRGSQIFRNVSLTNIHSRAACDRYRGQLGLPPIMWRENLDDPPLTPSSPKVPSEWSGGSSPPKRRRGIPDWLKKGVYPPNVPQPADLPLDGSTGVQDTVGVIVLDGSGNLACGASSGGPAMKDPGRIGPAAIPGAGAAIKQQPVGWRKTAVLATGSGEPILAMSSSSVAAERLFYLQTVDENLELRACPEDAVLPLYIRNEFQSKSFGHPMPLIV
jgi:hypothetical protein